LRVHDLDLARGQIHVRHGKGAKDRVVMWGKAANVSKTVGGLGGLALTGHVSEELCFLRAKWR
jgi:hypothetical protein